MSTSPIAPRPSGAGARRRARRPHARAQRSRPIPSTWPTRARSTSSARTLEAEAFFGLVHNAGQPYDVLAAMMAQDKAEAAMQVNFWSLTRLAKTLLRGMIRARAGRIVAIGSVAALQGQSRQRRLCGLQGRAPVLLPHARRRDGEARHHRQLHRARLHRHRHDGALRRLSGRHGEADPGRPLRRPGEIAGIVAFLMSPPAAYITGAVLPVDGGLTAMIGVHR